MVLDEIDETSWASNYEMGAVFQLVSLDVFILSSIQAGGSEFGFRSEFLEL